MGRPKRETTTNRDPITTNRDPRPDRRRETRRLIKANMPTVCPDCGGGTRMVDGRHVDPVRCKILEYRTCAKCGAKLAAGRDMTADEKTRLCDFREAVAEYEDIVRNTD
jgi:DNA-directed RNA polymerase subunit RPC12/RpoP